MKLHHRKLLVLLVLLVVAVVGLSVSTAVAGPYFDAVMAETPTYYWNYDETSGSALNHGVGAGGMLAQVGAAVRSPSTVTAGGLSLGSTAEFDGTSDGWFHTNVNGSGNSLQGGALDSYMIEFWTRADDNADNQYLSQVDGNMPSTIYNFNDDALEIYSNTAGRTGATGPTTLNDGNWHHVVVGYKDNGATGDTHTFIIDNGAPSVAYTGMNNQPYTTNKHFIVGADITGSSRYDGAIDELAVYDATGLSQTDFDAKMGRIASHSDLSAAAAPTPADPMTAYTWQMLKDNPRFYWNFNEAGPQDDAQELVRSQTNDTLIATGNAHRKPSMTENLGNTASFEGADVFAAAALVDMEMVGAWAIEMWVKPDGSLAGSQSDYLINAGSNNPAVIYDFGDGGDNKLELFSAAGRTSGGGPSVDDNEWHHLVMTFYGNGAGFGVADRVDMALDGVVQTVPRGGFSSGFELNEALLIGAARIDGTNGFQGRIDELAFWDLSGLTEAEVATKTSQLAGHYALASESAATPLRYVEGVTYEIDTATPTGAGLYADPDLTKLTDGVIGSSAPGAWGTDLWVGWNTVDPIVTFDLGLPSQLDSVFVDYMVGHAAGVHAPDDVTIEFSLDGVDFTSIDSIVDTSFIDYDRTPTVADGISRRLVVDLDDTMARFVRMTFANDSEWTFLSEVQFVEQVPEPSTWLLMSMGGVCLVLWRRRKMR